MTIGVLFVGIEACLGQAGIASYTRRPENERRETRPHCLDLMSFAAMSVGLPKTMV